MKFREIIPGKLYTRGRFDHRYSEAEIAKALYESKIDVVATLIRHPVSVPRHVRWYYMPITDGKIKNSIKLEGLAKALVEEIREEKKVLVHCNAGRNRTGLVCALIVRELLGISGSEALEYVRKVRPRAVDNPHFEEYLRSL